MELAARLGLLREVQRVVTDAQAALNASLARSAPANEAPPRVTLRVTTSPGLLASVTPVGTGQFVIRVPSGFGLRLLAWLRVLLPYSAQGHVDFEISPFGEFDRAAYRLPEQLQPVFGQFTEFASLEQAAVAMTFKRPLEDAAWTNQIEPMLGMGALYVVLHEAAHVALAHFDLRPRIATGYRLEEFGLTAADARRCLEIDADRFAALRTMEFAAGTAGQSSVYRERFADIARNCGFVWCALLGLFDHQMKVIEDFTNEDYLPPALRHAFMTIAAESLLRTHRPDLADVWADNERHAWTQAVSALHMATVDYAERPVKLRQGRSRTFAEGLVLGTRLGQVSAAEWPLGGMVYASVAEVLTGGDEGWQAFERAYKEWRARYGAFDDWRKAVLVEVRRQPRA